MTSLNTGQPGVAGAGPTPGPMSAVNLQKDERKWHRIHMPCRQSASVSAVISYKCFTEEYSW